MCRLVAKDPGPSMIALVGDLLVHVGRSNLDRDGSTYGTPFMELPPVFSVGMRFMIQ